MKVHSQCVNAEELQDIAKVAAISLLKSIKEIALTGGNQCGCQSCASACVQGAAFDSAIIYCCCCLAITNQETIVAFRQDIWNVVKRYDELARKKTGSGI